jgi:cyanate permease
MVLAHQGGWDEALMVLAPLAVLFWLLWLANRRAGRKLREQEAAKAVADRDPE